MADYSYNNNNQYSTTSYGAQGGGGGGGFMPGSQDEGSGGKRQFKERIRPVTIKQILDARQDHPDAEFKIDGEDTAQLTFVGQIQNISTQAVNTTYKLDDGTGTIEAKMLNNPDADASNQMDTDDRRHGTPTENGYARVFGRLKAFNDRRYVAALFVRPITDMNEVQYHLLDATVAHLYFTKGPLGDKSGAGGGADGAGQTNGGANGHTGRMLPAGMSNMAKRVYQLLNSAPQTNEGLHMQEIATSLSANMSEVNKAGDELLGQGLIYTTVDDQTWAILEEL